MEEPHENEIRDWVNQTLSKLCPHCSRSCCNLQNNAICIDLEETQAFTERGVKLYRKEDLATRAQTSKLGANYATSDLVRIQPPALVEQSDGKIKIYGQRFCPLYNPTTKRCTIHEDSRRPGVCKKFPVFLHSDSAYVPQGMILVKESCRLFNSDTILEAFENKFPTMRVVEEMELYGIKQREQVSQS
jgi:Fe-S-cluster containining protein